jgi:hypothetical protein
MFVFTIHHKKNRVRAYQPPDHNINIAMAITKPIAKASQGFINLSPPFAVNSKKRN